MKRIHINKLEKLDEIRVFLGHHDKRITGKRIDFRTGLHEEVKDDPLLSKAPFKGRGWEIDFFLTGRNRPELMVSADNFFSAYRGLQLVPASLLATGIDYEDIAHFEARYSWEADLPRAFLMHQQPKRKLSYRGLVKAAKIAAKASHKRPHQYALYRLLVSKRICDMNSLVTHHKYGEVNSANPFQHTMYSQAIVAAYGVIEELSLEMNKRHIEHGRYTEVGKQNLISRLSKVSLDGDGHFYWLRRSPNRQIERTFPFTQEERIGSRWQYKDDCLVSLVDAIHRAGRLRNKISAHKFNIHTAALSAVDVLNVQNLARLLILATLNCIDEDSFRTYIF